MVRDIDNNDAFLPFQLAAQQVCGVGMQSGAKEIIWNELWHNDGYRLARLPAFAEIASEVRYRNPVIDPSVALLTITQSGETADTLAAMRVARERGAHVVALTNIMGSQAVRDADGVLYTRAGLEIGVAATKTHVAQVMALALLALKLGQVRHTLSGSGLADLGDEIRRLLQAAQAFGLRPPQAGASGAARLDVRLGAPARALPLDDEPRIFEVADRKGRPRRRAAAFARRGCGRCPWRRRSLVRRPSSPGERASPPPPCS